MQSQGLDGAMPPLATIEEMAALYVSEMKRMQPRGPYLIGGYCSGGTVSIEMAQQLRAQGDEVALLA
jgi:thioesterase domain-containing protein